MPKIKKRSDVATDTSNKQTTQDPKLTKLDKEAKAAQEEASQETVVLSPEILQSLSDSQLLSLLQKAHEELGDIYFEIFKRQEVEKATDLIHLGIENLINGFIMTEFNNFIGYAKNTHLSDKNRNRRNGYYTRELNFIGLRHRVTLKLPRDREGLFKSSLFDVHARYLPEHALLLDKLTVSLRKRGISQQAISEAFNESLDGVTSSQATVSRTLHNHQLANPQTKFSNALHRQPLSTI